MNFLSTLKLDRMARARLAVRQQLERHRSAEHKRTCPHCSAGRSHSGAGGGLADLLRSLGAEDVPPKENLQ